MLDVNDSSENPNQDEEDNKNLDNNIGLLNN